MALKYTCPLCTDAYEAETDLRVHLEVEHRKSELATHLVHENGPNPDPLLEEESRLEDELVESSL